MSDNASMVLMETLRRRRGQSAPSTPRGPTWSGDGAARFPSGGPQFHVCSLDHTADFGSMPCAAREGEAEGEETGSGFEACDESPTLDPGRASPTLFAAADRRWAAEQQQGAEVDELLRDITGRAP